MAHGRTDEEVAELIGADKVVYQDLEDLKAACLEAADEGCEVTGFEVGVFCGKYQTEVPTSYFEHLSELKKKKGTKRKTEDDAAVPEKRTLVANGGPTNVAAQPNASSDDIRYVQNVMCEMVKYRARLTIV